MTTQEEKTAVLAVEQKNMAKEISEVKRTQDMIISDIWSMRNHFDEKLDRNYTEFLDRMEELENKFASKRVEIAMKGMFWIVMSYFLYQILNLVWK